MTAQDRIIVALDFPAIDEGKRELIENLSPNVGLFKIGLELIMTNGPLVNILPFMDWKLGGSQRVFLDAKLCDIPNTVAGASRVITGLGVKMFNVHCLGGLEMMTAAKNAVEDTISKPDWEGQRRPLILGVTILTSLKFFDLARMGFTQFSYAEIAGNSDLSQLEKVKLQELVKNLALLAKEAGLDGVIASPQEISVIREACGNNFLIVTPGVRPVWASAGDQKRVMTPAEAIKAGADYLVIGRPITKPPTEIGSPVDAAKKIAEEIAAVL